MKYLFKPKKFKEPKFKVGQTVWIIEDELQPNGEYIDKVKPITVMNVESDWDRWWLIDIKLGDVLQFRFLKYYKQSDSYTLENSTLRRVTSSDAEIFTTKGEADKEFEKYYG